MSEAPSRMPLLLGLLVVAAAAVWWDRTRDVEPELIEARRPEARGQVPADAKRVPGSAAAVASRERHPLAHLQLADLSDTAARPLFEPMRRNPVQRVAPPPPPAPKAAPAPVVRNEAPRHQLIGVVVAPDRSTALMAVGGERPIRVETGDSVDGWQVVEITQNEVKLSRGSQRMSLAIVRRVQAPARKG